MSLGDVIDQLHDHDGLPYACSSECPYFSALGKRADQINDLNPGFQHLRLRVLIHQRRSPTMNRITLYRFHRASFIHRLPQNIQHPPQNPFPNRNGDRCPSIFHGHSTLKSFGRGHGNRPRPIVPQVLLHFQHHTRLLPTHLVFHLQSGKQRRHARVSRKFHVHHRPDHLNDRPHIVCCFGCHNCSPFSVRPWPFVPWQSPTVRS